MLRVTTKVDCDSCKRSIEVDAEAHWQFDAITGETWGNVVLMDVASSLRTAGWGVNTDKDKTTCPDCKEVK